MALSAKNFELASAMRQRLRGRQLSGAQLRGALASMESVQLDAFVDALLGIDEIAADGEELPRGCVPYLPVGAAEILAMVDEVPLRHEQTLVDVGAGLGRVLLLSKLLTGARCIGIEVQSSLVREAQALAQDLALDDIHFERGDASDGLPRGDVYFLYAPFSGARLRSVMEMLQQQAVARPLTVCAVAFELPRETWLHGRATSSPELTIYESLPVTP